MPEAPTDTHGEGNSGVVLSHPEPAYPPETLDEPLGRLRAVQDPDQIAAAVRDSLYCLPLVLAAPGWVDDCGFAPEQQWWASITSQHGAAATFHAARDHLADALERARDTAEEIRGEPDPAGRAGAWLSHGPATLRYVAGVSTYARGLLTHTTPQALQGLLEAITRLAGISYPPDLPAAVYDLLYQANGLLVGERDWEPSLAEEAREWYGLSATSGTEAGFLHARDQVGQAAEQFQQSARPWLHVAVDPASAAGLAGPLAHECGLARAAIGLDH
jgi:hypothetical protein